MKILQQVKKYCEKEEKLLLRSNFSSFPHYFRYISKLKSSITYQFVKCGCLNYFFLTSANLICRGTDISKYFRESLGIRDNESRLYFLQTFWRKPLPPNHTCPKISTRQFLLSTYVSKTDDKVANCVDLDQTPRSVI